MSVRPSGGNLWQATARERVSFPPLAGDHEADLAVIGGGFTGCSAALRAAERGGRVVLLEAETIGHGGSGRNVGLVNAGLWLAPDDIAALLGPSEAARLDDALGAAPDRVFALIDRYAIDCEATRAGTLHCAHSPAGLRILQRRHRQLEARGAPVTLLSAEETAARTGTGRYFGALQDARAGTIQPLAYCAGLARAAAGLGASMHEASKVRAVRREGGQWLVSTAGGTVRAKAVLRAVNAYGTAPDDAGTPAFTPVDDFQVATAPLAAAEGAAILPGGEGCWDTARVMSSLRRDRAGRLIIGGIGGLSSAAAKLHLDWSRRKIARLFPQLADCALEYAWHGRIAMTADHIPKIVGAGPNHLSVFGYSGRGIGPGTVFGARAADMLLGSGADVLPLRMIEAYGQTLPAARGLLIELGAAAFHAIDSRRTGR